MEKGIIFNIQKFCIHDGDGIRTCVFLKGCPLRCVWCHNPEGLKREPTASYDASRCTGCGKCAQACSARSLSEGVIILNREECTGCGKCATVCLNDANEVVGRQISAIQVMDEVMKDKIFYASSGGGITVTGGEPSYQAEFTLELLRLSREAGISRAVETCGIGSRDFYERALSLGTSFLFDLKCMNPVRHKELTGADNSHIISNLTYLMDNGADIIIRMPMIPGCNDSDEDIEALCELLTKSKGRYRYAEIMPYHSLGTGKAEKFGEEARFLHENAGEEEISRWCEAFKLRGIDVRVSK